MDEVDKRFVANIEIKQVVLELVMVHKVDGIDGVDRIDKVDNGFDICIEIVLIELVTMVT